MLSPLLWIAFIFQYLWDTKQQNSERSSCRTVVNCFHFSVSLGYKTTHKWSEVGQNLLWIAFIFQYLWDTKQHFSKQITKWKRCELLSFFSIFGIQNNTPLINSHWYLVVNCFHFSVSLGYKTTNRYGWRYFH